MTSEADHRVSASESEGELDNEYDELSSLSDNEEYQDPDGVPHNTLESLGKSQDLKNMLVNPHLRDMLIQLDNEPNPGYLLNRFMNIPIFSEFAEQCMKLCNNKDTSCDGHMT
jgi:hypothetical protein